MLLLHVLASLLSLSECVAAACSHRRPSYYHPSLRKGESTHVSNFVDSLNQAFEAGNLKVPEGIDYEESSFSIELTSVHESLWDFHKTAQASALDKRGTAKVTGKTAYRIASISKVFTTLTALWLQDQGQLDFDDPVTKYVKDLPDKDTYEADEVHWRNITLRTMASQLSGIRRDSFKEIAFIFELEGFKPSDYGLPELSDEQIPSCGTREENRRCTRKEFFDDITSYPPLFNPNFRSTYSNVNFILLGEAAASAAATPWTSLIESTFSKLSMSESSVEKPQDSHGVIPSTRNHWGMDIGYYNATGGIYSTSNDLSRFLRYVLQDDLLRDKWLHPASFVSTIEGSYGMPWEIFRSTKHLPAERPVAFYTKGGSLNGYYSVIMFMPEQGLGLTILVAGDQKVLHWLMDKVTDLVVPGVDKIALRNVNAEYSGTYNVGGNTGESESGVTLRVDTVRGLYIDSWKSRGKDALKFFRKFNGAWDSNGHEDDEWHVQLFPTGRNRDGNEGEERWRAFYVLDKKGGAESKWDGYCLEDWDNVPWGGLAVSEFIFKRDESGQVTGVELPGWRMELEKVLETQQLEDEGLDRDEL